MNETPELPKLTLAQQKCCVVSLIEILDEELPKRVARQKMTQEQMRRVLTDLLCVAKTLDDADNFIDIREVIDPLAHQKALEKLNEELMPRLKSSYVARKPKIAVPVLVPFDAEE